MRGHLNMLVNMLENQKNIVRPVPFPAIKISPALLKSDLHENISKKKLKFEPLYFGGTRKL